MTLKQFFDKYMDDYKEMEFDEFLKFLKKECKVIKLNSKKTIPTKIAIDKCYFSRNGTVNDNKVVDFKNFIYSYFENTYYTWKLAVEKSNLHEDVFKKALIDLKYWNEKFRTKGLNNGIKYNLFTSEVITKVRDMAGENDINCVHVIQWYGPFTDVGDCDTWLKENTISKKEFNFYYGCGKKEYRHRLSYYIGISTQDYVTSRIGAATDPITRDFRDWSEKEFWIGKFSNQLNRGDKESVEKVETALIYEFIKNNKSEMKKDSEMLLNERKTSNTPSFSYVITNYWYKTSGERYKRNPKEKQCPKKILENMMYEIEK